MRRLLFLVVAVALVVGACDSGGDSEKSDENTTTTEEGSPADSRIDDLYEACEGGDDDACDDLYTESEAGSPEEAFGNNCGGRGLPPGEIWCGPERQAQDQAGEPDPEPAPTTPAPPPSQDEPNEEGELREGFIGICLDSGGGSRGTCECAFEYIVATYGLQSFGPDGSANQVEAVEALTACGG
ncbi:MAG: hypothetical protein R3A49_00205 [Acidimicrobiia bacterium]